MFIYLQLIILTFFFSLILLINIFYAEIFTKSLSIFILLLIFYLQKINRLCYYSITLIFKDLNLFYFGTKYMK